MTRLRSLLVNQHALAECAAKINLSSHFLELSSSAQQAIEKGYETIVSDAFEAIIAAIYLDSGIGCHEKIRCDCGHAERKAGCEAKSSRCSIKISRVRFSNFLRRADSVLRDIILSRKKARP